MSLELLLNGLSREPGPRGRQFERICGWFLRNAPEYRSKLRAVWLWDEWPGRWAADAGIDLVAETVEGSLWAIQAKAYDPAYSIKKADVDSFLSESARPEFSYRLLIATTDRIGQTARRTLVGQEKPAGALLRSQLALAEVIWPPAPDDLEPVRTSRKRPRRHQREAVAAVLNGFRSTDRGQAIMACGTGKTLVGVLVAEALDCKRTLVLVPSLSLLAQTLREWAANAARPFTYIAVCSDETVVGEDAVVSTTSELGLPVTTDSDAIRSFLADDLGSPKVVFATYQSSPRLAEVFAIRAEAFDLVIADEAHRCAGPQAADFATVLDNGRIGARRRLFMTATPRYFTGRLRRFAQEADFEVASMDDTAKFGPVLHRLSFGEAIIRGLLSDYQVVVVGVTDATYQEYAERGAFITRDGREVVDARTVGSQLGLLRAMAKYDLHRVVSFHSRIKSAREFSVSVPEVAEWLPEERRPTGELWAQHVSGEMSSGDRDRRLSRLRATGKSERGLLSNARCLAEGVDVPTLDGVAFIDPRRSQIEIVQAVGRAMRKSPEKILGTVVIPVFLNESDDPEEALSASDFGTVWQIVKALRAHDEILGEELDSLRRELGRRKSSVGRPKKIILDVPAGVGETFALAFDAKIVESASSDWHFMYGLLLDFKEQAGHLRAHPRLMYRGRGLGTWCVHQRVLERRGSLVPDRRSLLTAVGFEFALRDDRFEADFATIDRFVAEHGHLPRTSARAKEERRLANNIRLWRAQRADRTLPDWKRQRLDEIEGFFWSSFEQSLAPLAEFVREHGRRPNERRGADAVERRLAARLRALEGRPRTRSEQKLLSEVLRGLPQPKSREARRIEAADEIQSFVKTHGRLPKQASGDPKEQRLASRVNDARQAKRLGALTREDEKRFEAIPGWYWKLDLDEKFEQHATAVEAFLDAHGRLPSRGSREPQEAFLAAWCSSRKQEYRKGQLHERRLPRLRRIPGLLPKP